MSEQIICDDCGEVIDPASDHYRLQGSKVKTVDGVLTTVDPEQTLHYHVEHLPVYKVGGQPIEPPAPTPEPPVEEPTEVQS